MLAVDGKWVEVRFGGDILAYAGVHGEVPLPPYIKRAHPDAADDERYQTVFARAPGAVAAPDGRAALHARAPRRARGARHRARDGHAARRPRHLRRRSASTASPTARPMHAERYDVPDATAQAIAETRAAGRSSRSAPRSSARSRPSPTEAVRAGAGSSRSSSSGHRFRAVDALLTNFHLPRSTLLMLVAAFAGKARVLAAYAEAVARLSLLQLRRRDAAQRAA